MTCTLSLLGSNDGDPAVRDVVDERQVTNT